jgi:hypothetical protein
MIAEVVTRRTIVSLIGVRGSTQTNNPLGQIVDLALS